MTVKTHGVGPLDNISAADATFSGTVTKPAQPSFDAVVGTSILNVTGDGTSYTIIFDTENRDANADYDNTTGVFTTPVAGFYFFAVNIQVVGILSSHTSGWISLVTSNRSYLYAGQNNPYVAISNGTQVSYSGSWGTYMDAADTAKITVAVAGGTKVVDIQGLSNRTNFSGFLAC